MQSASQELLAVFARYPEAGKTKTRLIPAVGAEKANEIHRALAAKTLATAHNFRLGRRCKAEVHFTGGSQEGMQRTFGSEFDFVLQAGVDLGERLASATKSAFSRGYALRRDWNRSPISC